jgi:hypothetical protein
MMEVGGQNRQLVTASNFTSLLLGKLILYQIQANSFGQA